MRKYNICKPEKYLGKDGVERTMWHSLGTMTEFDKQDGSISRIIEIPAISLKANVFPFKERDGAQNEKFNRETTNTPVVPVEAENGDIPF